MAATATVSMNPIGKYSCYRLQTKFVKVMFLQVSVCPQGACVAGAMHGEGACMAGCMCGGGACMACMPPCQQILRDTVNEWAVHILLECILVNEGAPLIPPFT